MGSLTEAFARFTGGVHPVLVVAGAVLIAAGLLRWLAHHGFRAWRPGRHRGLLYSPILAAGFAVAMVAVDTAAPLAEDINVAFPASLVFYPTIGLVAEVAFHLVPLAILILVLRRVPALTDDRAVWAAIALAALTEPAFQTVVAVPKGYPVWQVAYTAVHIYALGLVQLWLFRRWDFASLYLFRLVYYLIWHIVWGELRLRLLF